MARFGIPKNYTRRNVGDKDSEPGMGIFKEEGHTVQQSQDSCNNGVVWGNRDI